MKLILNQMRAILHQMGWYEINTRPNEITTLWTEIYTKYEINKTISLNINRTCIIHSRAPLLPTLPMMTPCLRLSPTRTDTLACWQYCPSPTPTAEPMLPCWGPEPMRSCWGAKPMLSCWGRSPLRQSGNSTTRLLARAFHDPNNTWP